MRKHKRAKVPAGSRKWYHKGYKKGYYVASHVLALPKKATWADEVKPEITNLPDQNSIKWQGFTEAMNLIIASRR